MIPSPSYIIVDLQSHDENLSSSGFVLPNNPTELFRGLVLEVGTDIEWISKDDIIFFKSGYQIIEDKVNVVAVDAIEIVAKIDGGQEA